MPFIIDILVLKKANPGPGWSTFNHPSKAEFAYAVFSKLAPKPDLLEELQRAIK